MMTETPEPNSSDSLKHEIGDFAINYDAMQEGFYITECREATGWWHAILKGKAWPTREAAEAALRDWITAKDRRTTTFYDAKGNQKGAQTKCG